MKNIRFENKLRQMLSESSGRDQVKRMLNEALNNKEAECRSSYGETNWTLACSYGCIPSTGKVLTNIMIFQINVMQKKIHLLIIKLQKDKQVLKNKEI